MTYNLTQGGQESVIGMSNIHVHLRYVDTLLPVVDHHLNFTLIFDFTRIITMSIQPLDLHIVELLYSSF